MELVFIIGVARTGSKIYRNIINNNTDINILNEMHYISPRWIRKDFIHSTKKYMKKAKKNNNYDELINILYSNKLKGTFWNTNDWGKELPNNIALLDKEKLKREIENDVVNYKSIFFKIIYEHTKRRGKHVGGAKFPVEISYTYKLLKWFPNSKIIHIIRDPRAIYASMVYNDFKNFKGLKKLFKPIIRIYRMLFLIDQYKKAYKVHKDLKNNKYYFLSKFEDIVINPEKNIKELCEYLNVEYKEDMLYPPMVNSSFNQNKNKIGLNNDAVYRWKKKVNTLEKIIIEKSLYREIKSFKYEK